MFVTDPEPDLGNASVGKVDWSLLSRRLCCGYSYVQGETERMIVMADQPMCCGDSPFFGCRFSLYPMADRFVPIILDAVEALKRPGLVVETDDVSTCLLGREPVVFSALRDTLVKAAAGGTHVVMNTTFSKGCPGEGAVDPDQYGGGHPMEWVQGLGDLPVSCQFSLYPLGEDSYMSAIYDIIQEAKEAGLYICSPHFCTHLSGSIQQVFAFLETAFDKAAKAASHLVMTAVLSCNSPSQN